MKQVFEYCKNCNMPLSGRQKKFCIVECGWIYRARIKREEQTKKQLKQMEIDRKPMNYLRLNSSESAFNEAKRLL